MESFPPENSSAGRAHCPATSRMTWIASASSQSRWGRALEDCVGTAIRVSSPHGRATRMAAECP